MEVVGDHGHTLKQGPYRETVDIDALSVIEDSLRGGGVALGYPAVLGNGIHRWTIRVHSHIWMIGFATDVWIKELPGCQAKPGCWLLGSDGSKNDVIGSRNFGRGFGKECEVLLELWLDGTQATMKFAPEFQLLRTMTSVNFAAEPHNGTRIYPVVFGLRGIGNLATVVAYDGPQPFSMNLLDASVVTCHRAEASKDDIIDVMCTSASGNDLAVISCEAWIHYCNVTGVLADLHKLLVARLERPLHALILLSKEGCVFTGKEPMSELVLEVRCEDQRELQKSSKESLEHFSEDIQQRLLVR